MKVATITTAGLVLSVMCVLGSRAFAQDEALPESASPESGAPEIGTPEKELLEGPEFQYETGNILLPNKVATLKLRDSYRYLNPAETEKLLVAWGNEPGNDTQGAIVPNGVDPMGEAGWAVILTYDDDGHVDDSEAAEIDYDDLLSDMKKDTESANAARQKAGYQAVHLIGWAEKPRYDVANRKLYWAKELNFVGSDAHALNYDVRVLGREGVLSMNAVAGIGQLGEIRTSMQPLIEVAEFNKGYRYADYNSKTDKLAEYGLGALIAGGVAAKLGFFGKLAAMFLVFKKFIILGLAAIGGFLTKLFGRKKDSAA